MSAADVAGAAVPRHLQSLLTLRCAEPETEVAQASYKRPFQETRQELIERLIDPVLSLEETARLLNVCPTTVRRYTNRGILPHSRKATGRGGDNADAVNDRETRQRRFRLSDVLDFLESQSTAIREDRIADLRRASQDSDVEEQLTENQNRDHRPTGKPLPAPDLRTN